MHSSHPPLYHRFKTAFNPYSMRYGLFLSFCILSSLVSEFHEDVQQNKLFLRFDKRDQKFAHEPTMQTDKSVNQFIQSTESVVRPIPTVSTYHISEPIMSENSPKIYLFVSSKIFPFSFAGTLHDSTTHRKILAPFPFSPIPCNSFVHFFPLLSVLISFILIKVIFGACLLKQLFYSGLNHTPISYISQTNQKTVKRTFCHAPTSERRARDPRIAMIE